MKSYKIGDKVAPTAMKKMMTGCTQKRWVKSTKKDEMSEFKDVALTTIFDGKESVITKMVEHTRYIYMTAESKTQRIRWVADTKAKSFQMWSCVDLSAIQKKHPKKSSVK
jgi:hypothetical protein|tara:strand:+ start:5174 stop:5503 length:330 start_codon:yes stop_codon:yes gene_type:complete